jgi:hypothetical protein
MFDVTYLGHQGWLIESAATRVLVDPLLGDGLGNMAEDALAVYPPRRIDLDGFPPVDAVIATHEHADHLSIPTLLRLDRRIPVLLPVRASTAARGLLEYLGFDVVLLRSRDRVSIGDLEIHPFHAAELTRDEWDVTPIVVANRAGDGSFATSIDAPESAAFARFAIERAHRPAVWATSHNTMDLFSVREGAAQARHDETSERLVRTMIRTVERNFERGPRPEVLAVLASGFSFIGELAWINAHAFPGLPERIAPAVAASLPGMHVRAPLPGDHLSFSKGRLASETHGRPFFGPLDRSDWPPHDAEPHVGAIPDYGPACGRSEFSRDDFTELLQELGAFARHLYGGPLFRALYTAGDDGVTHWQAAVGFALRTPSETLTLAYRPEACSFEPLPSADIHRALAAGLTCWASDLLAMLRVEIFSGYVLTGRYRTWNAVPQALRCDLDDELRAYTHPLRHPARTLELYRRAVTALRGNAAARVRCVRARQA